MNYNDNYQKPSKRYPKKLQEKEIDQQAGIKRGNTTPAKLKLENVKNSLREMDLKQWLRRFECYNLPDDIDWDLLGRLLYFRGQVALFYYEPLNRFFVLPFGLSGDIDVYGRYNQITPVKMGGEPGKDEKLDSNLVLNVVKDVLSEEEDEKMTIEEAMKSCVIIKSHNMPYYTQNVIPRVQEIDWILEQEAKQLIWCETASKNSCGTSGIKCDAKTSDEIIKYNDQLEEASILGYKYIPIEAETSVNFKDAEPVDSKQTLQPQEFLQTFQSLDNYRLMTMGLENGGVFEKQGTILQSEANLNSNNTRGILLDDLRLIQKSFLIANQLWGTSMWIDLADENDAHEAPNDATGRDNMLDEKTEQLSTADDVNAGGVANV